MNIVRPPNRSVSEPMTIRPSDPTRIGVATSMEASVLLNDRSPAYVVDSGPIMFQAQKLIAETQVASARFTLLLVPVSGVVAVFTSTRAPPGDREVRKSAKKVVAQYHKRVVRSSVCAHQSHGHV